MWFLLYFSNEDVSKWFWPGVQQIGKQIYNNNINRESKPTLFHKVVLAQA